MAKYTQEQIDQVRDAAPAETAASVGARVGMDAAAVSYYRCKFRREGGGSKAKRKSPPSKQSATPEPAQEEADETVDITISLSPERADTWWNSLPLALKAQVFAVNFKINL